MLASRFRENRICSDGLSEIYGFMQKSIPHQREKEPLNPRGIAEKA
ncbi:MAG: hypothetical protein AAGD28_01955 [Bacteroidota bacterium]